MSKIYEGDELVEQYEAHRPTYPVELVTEVLKFLDDRNPGEKRRGFMLDVGCGGGQATRLFASHFEKVLGIDVSNSQINMAKKIVPGIEFKIGSASDLPVESGSVDLIIVGMAAHYFDFDVFLSECDRVLKPGGCAALFAYSPCTMKTARGNVIEGCYLDSGILNLYKYYAQEVGVSEHVVQVLEQHYQPLHDRINKTHKRFLKRLELEKHYTVGEFINFLGTIGEYRANEASFEDKDPLLMARNRLEKLLGISNDNH